MRRPNFLLSACTFAALLALPACGPGSPGDSDSDSDSDSDTDADTGNTTEPVPLTCAYGSEVYDDGEEFETPDGCVRYRCEGGGLTVLVDNLVTVSGDLDLPTQEAVDEQTCLSVVEGSLSISGTAADLTELGQLTRVGGSLEIVASEAQTLAGLERLAEVGQHVVIADNAALTQLSFQVWMSVFGDVTIQNNDALASLAGAEFIGQCAACAPQPPPDPDPGAGADSGGGGGTAGEEPGGDSAGAPAGEDGGLDEPSGGTFYGNILIADNDVLADVGALGNLWYAWADVRLRNNAALTSLATIPLSEVQGSLEISRHPLMSTADVDAFVAGIDVWGETLVCGNADGEACP